ncbi:hypothetical protein PanWU01x14_058780 [Parasponia andersonii]|uniref:Uncharacterized protein n=1 Tax=Parasponia andersonii TaxID=3476 RepID=A0A2P5DJ96_PARAD|nr:hypothetical protein PanWU01x14_058780 [Parasponia andersonii]
MFEIAKDKPSVLKGKSTPVDDLDEEPYRDSSMLVFLHVAKGQSFVREDEGKLKSLVLDLKSNISRVEEELWFVKDKVRGDDDVGVGVEKESENFMTSNTEQTTGFDESVKQVDNKEEEKVTGVNDEEMKEKIQEEEEEQKRWVALDIEDMGE